MTAVDALFTYSGGMFLPGPLLLVAIVAWAVWDWARKLKG